MNLLDNKWIPVQRENGDLENIAPWQIVEMENPVIKLASPRHDFDGSLIQFLIGLLQTACTPEDHDKWVDWLETPPSPEDLNDYFRKYKKAFEVDTESPCFMQDFESLDAESKPISGLLIEAPGTRTSKLFLDHFVKDGFYNGFCANCAVTALFALQTNAPSGGVGHRTSLRGGGPLTTLIIPDTQAETPLPDTLWTTLWLNILDEKTINNSSGNNEFSENEYIFPWLAKTITSEAKTGKAITSEQASPLQMYWGMPRRIRLEWGSEIAGCCDICGCESSSLVTHYKTKNYGVNYTVGWEHPLSPHYQEKKTHEHLPMHAQPGGLAYRYWLGWTQGSENNIPAKIVSVFLDVDGRKIESEQIRLWVFGYDMDNMKARCWYEKQYPLFVINSQIEREDFSQRVNEMIGLASQISGFVQSCVKEAWFDRPADSRGSTDFIKEAFYEQTESIFLSLLGKLRESVSSGEPRSVLQLWHKQLVAHAMRLFDHWAANGDIAFDEPKRIAKAQKKLRNLLFGKKMLGSLGLGKDKEKVA